MKRYFYAGVVLFALVLTASVSRIVQAADKPAAIVISVQGDVKVQRDGKQKDIKGKFPLNLKDTVIVGKGASAVVLFANGKKVTATANLEISEAAAAIDGKAGGSGVAGMVASAVAGSGGSDLSAKGGVAGAVRAAGDAATVQLLSYLNTSTTETRPVFAWRPSAPSESSTVVLMNEDGEEVWKTDTKDSLAAYPEDMDPLEQGLEYTVEVTCVIDGAPVSTASTFYIVDEDEAAEIKEGVDAISKAYPEDEDVAIRHMLLGGFYKEKELFMQSLSEYEKLVAMDPFDTMSLSEIAAIHLKTGNVVEAKSVLAKVEEINKESGSF